MAYLQLEHHLYCYQDVLLHCYGIFSPELSYLKTKHVFSYIGMQRRDTHCWKTLSGPSLNPSPCCNAKDRPHICFYSVKKTTPGFVSVTKINTCISTCIYLVDF